MNCLHCGATTSNGLGLCELCQRKGETDLLYLPVYFRNLARWRPGRAGARPVPGSRVLWDGSEGDGGDRIERALDEAANMLTTWARALVDNRPHFPRPLTLADAVLLDDLPAATADALNDDAGAKVAWLCAGLAAHLTSISTIDWCGEIVRDLGIHEERLRVLTEDVAPGWYAGACRLCSAPTHVVPGLTWVTCSACGTTTYARDHLDVILDEARGWVARPKQIAAVLVALLDGESDIDRLHGRIRKWESLGWIDSVRLVDADGDAVGPKRYRLGTVVDMLSGDTDAPTRVTRMTSA